MNAERRRIFVESALCVPMFQGPSTAPVPMDSIPPLGSFGYWMSRSVKKSDAGLVTCVYWEANQTAANVNGADGAAPTPDTAAAAAAEEEEEEASWSVKGCWVAYSDENYTICSCSHLSTFALIMQIGDPPPPNPFLEWLNRVGVIIGLFFFALAILTFLLCSFNAKINNTARLHLCITLALSHLLLLWNDRYTENKVACKVMAGLLHFLIVASFWWMFLEAMQLFMLVRRLSKVQVIQKDGLPTPVLYLIGYGAPFVTVGVSALVFSDGYGAIDAEVCWLTTERSFNWALTGPVIALLGMNWVLFCATLWNLRSTLASMRSGASQSKDTRLIVFKILAQFVILGCTWILGLYQSNLFFQVLFIFLNSQQGTFLFIVHCLLNKEVREEYIKWLSCAHRKSADGGPTICHMTIMNEIHVVDTISPMHPGSCNGYTNLTDPWRNRAFLRTDFPGFPKHDGLLKDRWWRFTGVGGDTAIITCNSNTGGFESPWQVTMAYPTAESVTPARVHGTRVADSCGMDRMDIELVLCPDGFHVFRPLSPGSGRSGFATYHAQCGNGSCGALAECDSDGGCVCVSGYKIPDKHLPVNDTYDCTDIDECTVTPTICGPDSICDNDIGIYNCSCQPGFNDTNPAGKLGVSHNCIDIDECIESLCGQGDCQNSAGSFACDCHTGYHVVPSAAPLCQDIDECFNTTVCGPNSNCTNVPGDHICQCEPGYIPMKAVLPPDEINICIDVDECTDDATICSLEATYIDECRETKDVCGIGTVCTNVPGTFDCSCPDGYFPSTGILWILDVSFCQSLEDILDAIKPPEAIAEQLKDNPNVILSEATVTNSFSASVDVLGVSSRSSKSSDGDADTGNVMLDISEGLVSSLVEPNMNGSNKTIQTPAVGINMAVNLEALAKDNNGSAAAAVLILSGMESLLSDRFFKTENQTEMNSDIITAFLPKTNHSNFSQPVNFTIQHKKKLEAGLVTCVYWKEKQTVGKVDEASWSVTGCWVAYSNENYTICSCSHLSTFALILQIEEPPSMNPFLEWLNRVGVTIGLFFFALAILTFLLCSWNTKINNTARLHLCITLALSHLLLLWNDRYKENKVACKVMAGLLHFLIVASFWWMFLEAMQLFTLVRRLSKVQVIQKDGLPTPVLYLIGYGAPFVTVGVSALVFSDGYGATDAEVCWLTTERSFNWALTGPVVALLGMNWVLFCATLWSIRSTLASMRSGASQSKDTRLIVFKILAQFVILGCTWILGLYQSNLFFQVLFIVLNSQQGTFLFIVHCLLNKEVREEYIKWLSCAYRKSADGGPTKDLPSGSEDIDATEDQERQ
ncbi:hypothetical protein NHX12_031847 [Muraenolepis orangiensis]|uniref:Uncharacterized protein n=1 Tax=Muraenolepis orangiensis TaxID=630683 RepID=A0A9Q0E889_9TELE|nr:hypothetical protein NHX12_031847 [Muraenolepis orangiensis]